MINNRVLSAIPLLRTSLIQPRAEARGGGFEGRHPLFGSNNPNPNPSPNPNPNPFAKTLLPSYCFPFLFLLLFWLFAFLFREEVSSPPIIRFFSLVAFSGGVVWRVLCHGAPGWWFRVTARAAVGAHVAAGVHARALETTRGGTVVARNTRRTTATRRGGATSR